MRFTVSLFAALLLAVCSFGQTTPAPTELPGYSVQVLAGYSLVTGAGNNNGFFSSVAVPAWHNKSNSLAVQARADYFSINKPSSYYVGGGPEFRYAFAKPTIFNGQVFEPFADVQIGAAETSDPATGNPTGTKHFALKVGGGLDTVLKGNVTWRLFQVDWIHSTIYPGNGIVLSNFAQISTGIGIRF